jgi:hypothetical protein
MDKRVYNQLLSVVNTNKEIIDVLTGGGASTVITRTLNQRPVVDSNGDYFVAIDNYDETGVLNTAYVNPDGTAAVPVGAIEDVTEYAFSQLVATTFSVTASIAEGANVVEGTTTDAAAQGDVNGTINAHLRGVAKVLGSTTDIAVAGDLDGSLNAHLRGLLLTVGTQAAAAQTNPAATDSLMAFIKGTLTVLTDKTQFTKITDGTDTLVVNPDGSLNLPTLQHDAFYRIRTSQVTSALDVKYHSDNQPLLVSQVLNGTASSTFSDADASVTLATAANGDYAIRQTFERGIYQNGKGVTVEFTTTSFQLQTNIVKRVGFFSSDTVAPYDTGYDGIMLVSDGLTTNTIRFQVWKSGTLMVDVPQASWADPLDGTGASGITVDWSKMQLIGFDFGWLGGNAVRLFLFFNGIPYLVYSRAFTNDFTSVYISSPNQGIRKEIRQTGAGAGSLADICSTQYIEGVQDRIGITNSVGTGISTLTATTAGTVYAAVGIQLKTTNLDAIITIIGLSLGATTADDFLWELRLNPTIAGGGITYAGVTNFGIETGNGVAANTVTGGTVLASGIVEGNSTLIFTPILTRRIGCAINGTRDQLVLCITGATNGLQYRANLTYLQAI